MNQRFKATFPAAKGNGGPTGKEKKKRKTKQKRNVFFNFFEAAAGVRAAWVLARKGTGGSGTAPELYFTRSSDQPAARLIPPEGPSGSRTRFLRPARTTCFPLHYRPNLGVRIRTCIRAATARCTAVVLRREKQGARFELATPNLETLCRRLHLTTLPPLL